MSDPQANGVVLNTRSISTIVGVIAILAAVFAFFEKINSYEIRLDKVEFSDSLRTDEIKTLTLELKSLNSKLTDLTIELREMRASQKANYPNNN